MWRWRDVESFVYNYEIDTWSKIKHLLKSFKIVTHTSEEQLLLGAGEYKNTC